MLYSPEGPSATDPRVATDNYPANPELYVKCVCEGYRLIEMFLFCVFLFMYFKCAVCLLNTFNVFIVAESIIYVE